MHAVVVSGGRGTRLRPLTETRPKPLMPFMGQPYALGLLRRLADAGCDRCTFLVGRDPRPFSTLESAAAELGVRVRIVPEEQPLDTAGSARRVLRGTGERSVLVCNGDVLTDVRYEELLEAHASLAADATLALMGVDDPSSYGVIECDGHGRVERFVEKPDPGTTDHRTVNAGAYVLDATVFDRFAGEGPLSFERDVFPGLLEAGATLVGVEPPAHWQDLGTPERYRAGHRAVLEGRCRWPDVPGMRRMAPRTVVHEEAHVHPSARLEGPCVIGRGAHVARGASVTDAVLFEGARVGRDAVVQGAVLGEGSEVADGSAVGPDVVLADGVSVDGRADRARDPHGHRI